MIMPAIFPRMVEDPDGPATQRPLIVELGCEVAGRLDAGA